MFGKIFSWVGGLFGKVRNGLGLFVAMASVCAVSLCSGTLFAQTSTPIPLETPNIDWQSLPGTLIGVLTTPVVVGIGIALSIWVILKAMAFFKRAA
jgi:hypothetical protein